MEWVSGRCGINITYSVSWLRQEENQYLTVPIETARTLPTSLLRLIGYRRGAFGLGYVDDLRDPIELVRPEETRRGFGDFEALQKRLENIMTPASYSGRITARQLP
jgi:ectoine hydroxylase-related dioxygenase (phytanoyl-CoA dioxygenase family)